MFIMVLDKKEVDGDKNFISYRCEVMAMISSLCLFWCVTEPFWNS